MSFGDIVRAVEIVVLGLLAATFAVGFVKTLMEGPAGFARWDQAGFTLSAWWNGTVPDTAAGRALGFSESAEIEIVDGKIDARPIRTIAKHVS